jgi:hypothetical protein
MIDGIADDPRFAETEFVVEATSYEQLCLWRETHESWPWEQDHRGIGLTIGHVGEFPVCLSLSWVRVGGRLILFWTAVSRITDYAMADEWFQDHCNPRWDRRRRRAFTDAMNFHHVLAHIRETLSNRRPT